MLLVVTIIAALCGTAFAQTAKPATASSVATGKYEHDAISRTSQTSDSTINFRSVTNATPNTDNSLDVRRVLLALGIVLGLVFAIRWTMRWIFPTASVARSSQVMKVLSRSVIAPKQQLLLVQVGKRLVVVGDCGTQMNALAEITDPDEVASLVGQLRIEPVGESSSKFGPLLGRSRQRFEMVPSAGDEDEAIGDDTSESDSLQETRSELSGLTDKIRMLSQHLGKT